MKFFVVPTIALTLTGILWSSSLARTEHSLDQTLDVKKKKVEKLEVSTGFGGYRSTLIFYTFNEQRAVLRIEIDNKSKDFPITAKLYTFASKVTAKDLDKWLNNQYSDGLFADAPKPNKEIKVKAEACRVKSSKFVSREKSPFGVFEKYKVKFQVVTMAKFGEFKLKDFTEEATVYLKSK